MNRVGLSAASTLFLILNSITALASICFANSELTENYNVLYNTAHESSCTIDTLQIFPYCDDNGTPADSTDDVFYFDLTVTNNMAGGWYADNGPPATTGVYGTPANFGPFPIGSGPVNFVITDNDSMSCSIAISINPPETTCSSTCELSYFIIDVICENGGTPNDPSDDTFYTELFISGLNTGPSGQWSTIIPPFTTHDYDDSFLYGPLPVSGGVFSFTVADVDNFFLCRTDVLLAPTTPTLTPIGPFFETDSTFQLSAMQDGITGSWSGIGVSNNQFDPAVAGTSGSPFVLTFTPDVGQCAQSDTIHVVVNGPLPPGNFLFVDQSVASDGDGLSWANAIKELATALDSAWQNPYIDTIYVAEGIYKPTTKPYEMNVGQTGTPIVTSNPRDVTFHIRTGLTIIGGFSSDGIYHNPDTFSTILSGDIGTASLVVDNAFHVVLTDRNNHWNFPNSSTNLTGLNVRNGRATGGGNITLGGNTLSRNNAGGIYHLDGSLLTSKLQIDSNYADNNGGGFFTVLGEVILHQTTFTHNISDRRGAACYLSNGAAELQYCKFLENNRTEQSIEVLYVNGPKIIVDHTDFDNNSDAAINVNADTMIFSNSSITRNAGFYSCEFDIEFLKISNCVFKDNSDPYNFGGLIHIFSNLSHPYNLDQITLKNNKFINNNGGTISCMASLSILENVFIGNKNIGFASCIESDSYYPDSVYLANNLFYNNDGGSVNIRNGIPIISNNTFVQNKGTALRSGCDITYVSNCIFWENTIGGQNNVQGVDFVKSSSALDARFTNNRMQLDPSQYYDRHDLGTSVDNIFQLPLYFTNELDYDGPDNVPQTSDDGFILVPGSNGINQGTNSYVESAFDITGAVRIQDGIVDMGAYETDCPSASPRLSQSGTTIFNQDFNPSTSDSTHLVSNDIINNPPTVSFYIHNDSLETLALVNDKIKLADGSIFSILQFPASDTIQGQDSAQFVLTAILTDCQLLDSIIRDTINIISNSCTNNPYQFAVSIEITGNVLPNLITPNDTIISCDQLNDILMMEAILDGNCDSINVSSVINPNSINCSDTLLRIWTIEDVNGNQSMDSQQIILFDIIAPIITTLVDTIINCSDYNQILSWPPPAASDNCDTAISFSFVDSIIQNTCSDTVYRKWTATDDCGNSSTTIRKITLIDNVAPSFTSTLPQNQTYYSPGNSCTMSLPIPVPSLMDFCGNQTFIDISSSDSTVYFFYIPSSNIWLASIPVGITNITITGNDGCGNFATHNFSITIIETIPPQLSACPANISGFNHCDGIISWQNPIVADNCLPDSLVISFELIDSYTLNPFIPSDILYTGQDVLGGQFESEAFCQGLTRVTIKVIDASGNEDVCFFDVDIPSSGLTTFYVDQSATGSNSGYNWTNAYTSLEQLLNNECIMELDTIKIAKGIYKPETLDRNFSYTFSGSTVVIGGYSPGGSSFNPDDNTTVLSGNTGANTSVDNLFHVVTIETSAVQVQLHHLAIRRGNANESGNDSGAGILAFGKAAFHNVHVFNNYSIGFGSGVSVQSGGDVSIYTNSVFQNNNSRSGIIFDVNEGGELFIENDVEIR